jgi:hypothetical protein
MLQCKRKVVVGKQYKMHCICKKKRRNGSRIIWIETPLGDRSELKMLRQQLSRSRKI